MSKQEKGQWGGARPGAGRKKSGGPRITVSISISETYAESLRQAAENENTTPGRYIENHLKIQQIENL